MRGTIDKAGRLVIPKSMRDRLGLGIGEVELTADGNALRVEAVTHDSLEEREGRLVIPRSGGQLTTTDIHGLRAADQR